MQTFSDEVTPYERADERADERHALLDDLASKWTSRSGRRLGIEAEMEQLLTPDYIQLLSWIASGGRTVSPAEITTEQGLLPDVSTEWCGTLGYLLSVHGEQPETAIRLLRGTLETLTDGDQRRKYGLQLIRSLLAVNRTNEAKQVHSSLGSSLTPADAWVACDLALPRPGAIKPSEGAWQELWSALYTQYSLTPPTATPAAVDALSAIKGPQLPRVHDREKVTVVVDTLDGSARTIMWAIRSLEAQTWENLQILVVVEEDGELAEAIVKAPPLDPRVEVFTVRSGESWHRREDRILNGIHGEYVAWHESTWWSHPERITQQVETLRSEGASSVTASAMTVSHNLSFSSVPGQPFEQNASSVLMRTDDLRELGGRLDLGDLAIEELITRLALFGGSPQVELDSPLILVAAETSPSRLHPLAQHDMRTLFLTHRTAVGLPAPAPWKSGKTREITCDVLVVGDWYSYGGPQKSMIEEIEAYIADGRSVAIMHLRPSRMIGERSRAMCDQARDLIFSGRVTLAHQADRVRAEVTFLRYPPILAFGGPKLDVRQEHLVIVANQAPSERDGSDVRYRVEDVREHARKVFGAAAMWAPQGPQVRETVVGRVPADELLDLDLVGVLDTKAWVQDRRRRRSDLPVIGRHSRDNAMKWPGNKEELLAIYPDSPQVDVRVMGGAKSVRSLLNGAAPSHWLVFNRDELPVQTFLNSLDFFVYFQHDEAYDAFGRATLEALATGVVTILPHRMERVFGSAALYAEPDEVSPLVRELFEHPSKYQAQSKRALAYVREHFSYDSHLRRVDAILQRSVGL